MSTSPFPTIVTNLKRFLTLEKSQKEKLPRLFEHLLEGCRAVERGEFYPEADENDVIISFLFWVFSESNINPRHAMEVLNVLISYSQEFIERINVYDNLLALKVHIMPLKGEYTGPSTVCNLLLAGIPFGKLINPAICSAKFSSALLSAIEEHLPEEVVDSFKDTEEFQIMVRSLKEHAARALREEAIKRRAKAGVQGQTMAKSLEQEKILSLDRELIKLEAQLHILESERRQALDAARRERERANELRSQGSQVASQPGQRQGQSLSAGFNQLGQQSQMSAVEQDAVQAAEQAEDIAAGLQSRIDGIQAELSSVRERLRALGATGQSVAGRLGSLVDACKAVVGEATAKLEEVVNGGAVTSDEFAGGAPHMGANGRSSNVRVKGDQKLQAQLDLVRSRLKRLSLGCALVGHTGSGKTSLAIALTGLPCLADPTLRHKDGQTAVSMAIEHLTKSAPLAERLKRKAMRPRGGATIAPVRYEHNPFLDKGHARISLSPALGRLLRAWVLKASRAQIPLPRTVRAALDLLLKAARKGSWVEGAAQAGECLSHLQDFLAACCVLNVVTPRELRAFVPSLADGELPNQSSSMATQPLSQGDAPLVRIELPFACLHGLDVFSEVVILDCPPIDSPYLSHDDTRVIAEDAVRRADFSFLVFDGLKMTDPSMWYDAASGEIFNPQTEASIASVLAALPKGLTDETAMILISGADRLQGFPAQVQLDALIQKEALQIVKRVELQDETMRQKQRKVSYSAAKVASGSQANNPVVKFYDRKSKTIKVEPVAAILAAQDTPADLRGVMVDDNMLTIADLPRGVAIEEAKQDTRDLSDLIDLPTWMDATDKVKSRGVACDAFAAERATVDYVLEKFYNQAARLPGSKVSALTQAHHQNALLAVHGDSAADVKRSLNQARKSVAVVFNDDSAAGGKKPRSVGFAADTDAPSHSPSGAPTSSSSIVGRKSVFNIYGGHGGSNSRQSVTGGSVAGDWDPENETADDLADLAAFLGEEVEHEELKTNAERALFDASVYRASQAADLAAAQAAGNGGIQKMKTGVDLRSLVESAVLDESLRRPQVVFVSGLLGSLHKFGELRLTSTTSDPTVASYLNTAAAGMSMVFPNMMNAMGLDGADTHELEDDYRAGDYQGMILPGGGRGGNKSAITASMVLTGLNGSDAVTATQSMQHERNTQGKLLGLSAGDGIPRQLLTEPWVSRMLEVSFGSGGLIRKAASGLPPDRLKPAVSEMALVSRIQRGPLAASLKSKCDAATMLGAQMEVALRAVTDVFRRVDSQLAELVSGGGEPGEAREDAAQFNEERHMYAAKTGLDTMNARLRLYNEEAIAGAVPDRVQVRAEALSLTQQLLESRGGQVLCGYREELEALLVMLGERAWNGWMDQLESLHKERRTFAATKLEGILNCLTSALDDLGADITLRQRCNGLPSVVAAKQLVARLKTNEDTLPPEQRDLYFIRQGIGAKFDAAAKAVVTHAFPSAPSSKKSLFGGSSGAGSLELNVEVMDLFLRRAADVWAAEVDVSRRPLEKAGKTVFAATEEAIAKVGRSAARIKKSGQVLKKGWANFYVPANALRDSFVPLNTGSAVNDAIGESISNNEVMVIRTPKGQFFSLGFAVHFRKAASLVREYTRRAKKQVQDKSKNTRGGSNAANEDDSFIDPDLEDDLETLAGSLADVSNLIQELSERLGMLAGGIAQCRPVLSPQEIQVVQMEYARSRQQYQGGGE